MLQLKKGYRNGAKTIEILDGNLDLILYSDNQDNFQFYRFSPSQILGHAVRKDLYLVYPEQVSEYLQEHGKEYEGLINELMQLAHDNSMRIRSDM